MTASQSKQSRPIRRVALVLGLPLLAVALVSGGEATFVGSDHSRLEAKSLAQPGFGPATFEEALERASHSVEYHRSRVAQSEGEWLRREGLARSLHRRSQLTGSFADLAEAAGETQQGMSLALKGSGPMLTWATISMSSHDLAQSEIALAKLAEMKVPPRPAVASEIILLNGDLSFYRGDPSEAARAYNKAERMAPSAGSAIRLARLAKSRAEYDAAKAWLIKSSKRAASATPYRMAHVRLQIGAVELARGEYAAAHESFEKANKTLPGHWLIEAHLAQSLALKGELDAAIEKMRALAERTQSPDLMDALANMLRTAGHEVQSRAWIERSRKIWDQRMRLLPEAAIGHALEHELAFGTPERALDLAQRNLAIRPYGEAHLLMAQAFRKAGQFESAQEHINKAKQAGLHSAPLYAAESEMLVVLGQLQLAQITRDKARMLNPQIFAPETAFVWFSHG